MYSRLHFEIKLHSVVSQQGEFLLSTTGHRSSTKGVPAKTDRWKSKDLCQTSWSKLPGRSAHHEGIRYGFTAIRTQSIHVISDLLKYCTAVSS